MSTLYFVLTLLALISFIAATLEVPVKLNLVALGLSLWVTVVMIQFARASF